jgi:hypothetical protein
MTAHSKVTDLPDLAGDRCCVRKRKCGFIKTTKNLLHTHKKRKMIQKKKEEVILKLRQGQGPFLRWTTVTYEPQAHPSCIAENEFPLVGD